MIAFIMSMLPFPPTVNGPLSGVQLHFADAQMIARIRVLLTLSALLVLVVEPRGNGQAHGVALALLACYGVTCTILAVRAQCRLPFAHGPLMHRLDMAAFFVIFVLGGHADISPYIFLMFAILVASLRWGLGEGACVTIAAVALYCAATLAAIPDMSAAQLLPGCAVLLSLGFAITLLGERNIQVTRRLALLRELNVASNPRFGVERSMTQALENTRAFFAAERCILLLEEHESGQYFYRSVRQGGPLTVPAESVDAQLAHALLPTPRSHILLYRCRWPWPARTALSHAGEPGRWRRSEGIVLAELAELLGANCFISAPLVLGRGKGRIYVTSCKCQFGRGDALFLAQIVAQGLGVIDSIDLLDRLASEAACIARKKFALDLHDTAIQPYVGLKLGLAALRRKAAPGNPLIEDLDRMMAVADDVILGLRDYACGVRDEPGSAVPICQSALQRQCEHTMASYGVDIELRMEGAIGFGDRLTAQVLQIVREGLSNICRHTQAKRGAVLLRCSGRWLHIEINNESSGKSPPAFLPRSISARAAALGGIATVRQGPQRSTVVCVKIPV